MTHKKTIELIYVETQDEVFETTGLIKKDGYYILLGGKKYKKGIEIFGAPTIYFEHNFKVVKIPVSKVVKISHIREEVKDNE